MVDDNCKTCGNKIEVMAYRGTGYCGVDCKKKAGIDTPSLGTFMFVSIEEKKQIDMSRRAVVAEREYVNQNGVHNG